MIKRNPDRVSQAEQNQNAVYFYAQSDDPVILDTTWKNIKSSSLNIANIIETEIFGKIIYIPQQVINLAYNKYVIDCHNKLEYPLKKDDYCSSDLIENLDQKHLFFTRETLAEAFDVKGFIVSSLFLIYPSSLPDLEKESDEMFADILNLPEEQIMDWSLSKFQKILNEKDDFQKEHFFEFILIFTKFNHNFAKIVKVQINEDKSCFKYINYLRENKNKIYKLIDDFCVQNSEIKSNQLKSKLITLTSTRS